MASVEVLSRDDFLDRFADEYGDGQHVTFLGPTQRGKTTLCFQMLDSVISPQRQCIVLAGKPPGRDPVMAKAAQNLNLVIIEQWPPTQVQRYKARKRNGYLLRPRQTLVNPDDDKMVLRQQFGRGIIGNYSNTKQPTITVADETFLIHNDLRLKNVCEAPLTRGAPHAAMWSLVQRSRNVSMHCYSAPEWVLAAYDPDADNQKRLADIGGVDPVLLRQILRELHTATGNDGRSTVSEFACIKRSGPEVFIVGIA